MLYSARQRAVKQHVRTAEGRAEAADQVRSLDWLRITVTYLLGELQVSVSLLAPHPNGMLCEESRSE